LRKSLESAVTSFNQIDWTRTKAYCSEKVAATPSIWINLKGVKPRGIVEQSEYEPLLKLISDKLKELKDPRTGEPVIKRILRREEIFHGPYTSEAADLMLDWWETSHFSTKHSFLEEMLKPAVQIRERRPSTASEWGGTHRRDGILIAHGKAFKKGAEIQGARLIDMAPTILYLLGQPVPEDMDGHVLEELFEPAFIAANRVQAGGRVALDGEQGTKYSDEEAAIVEERLKGLGYIE
jgi:predicted AlkP superfamily phosphohydrolase/phosphomutase